MSNFKTPRTDDEVLTSPSSDEKMDTGSMFSSESFKSQDTPNSLSSDFEEGQDQNVLRLQNPSEPDNDNLRTAVTKFKSELNDSLITRMTNLNIESPKDIRPRNLGVSPPKFSSTLTLTTNHPLMALGSPEENFPDVIPKKLHKIEDEKDLSLSSIEDERPNETNGFYSPQRNTSKNNLYFTENFVTADSQMLDSRDGLTPDVARVDREKEGRKLLSRFTEVKRDVPPHRVTREGPVIKYVEKRQKEMHSTPKVLAVDIPEPEEFHSGVAEWCESPSHLRAIPNFELPIELSSNISINNGPESPDVVSSSTAEDRSAYQALLDPYTGSVALRPTPVKAPTTQRRKIKLPPEEDRCSLDSVSACSMESEEEPPEPEPSAEPPPQPPPAHSDDEDTRRSRSTNTLSECSDPIPEYSAAEELSNERSWLSVPRAGRHHTCDMKVIEPYKRVISHGGYEPRGAAVIVFSACHLPDSARPDYRYVMDNLFLYVIWTLERLVTDEYVLVYLHGSAGSRKMPTFHWLHECYKLIDRRLRKSLKHLYLVHPTFWLKSFVILTKPFVSSKFFRKLSYVRNLDELMRLVPVEPNAIPDQVKLFDAGRR
ncbi:protein prune homolog 2 [Galleria mellonella]|uniref:Protein prune homolog 2 n=1 Tax=Galleria mellonella TaxID=7137 RepID=A0ABM3N0E7_GALME|nr:protein prune homolog 2 [Galleria mellonella]